MLRHLIFAHQVFLTRDQRYALQTLGAELSVAGSFLRTLVSDDEWKEPDGEFFVTYLIRHAPTMPVCPLSIENEQFVITIAGEAVIELKDIKDGGACFLVLHAKLPGAVHAIEFDDMSRLHASVV